MTNFGQKSVTLSHDQSRAVRFTIEVDFAGDGTWHRVETVSVPAGQPIVHPFADGFAAHWVRVTPDSSARATAWFRYEPATALLDRRAGLQR
jgi:hypothetical protein